MREEHAERSRLTWIGRLLPDIKHQWTIILVEEIDIDNSLDKVCHHCLDGPGGTTADKYSIHNPGNLRVSHRGLAG
jgi:hypothetical protein